LKQPGPWQVAAAAHLRRHRLGLLAAALFSMPITPAAAADGQAHGLWNGEASIVLPPGVKKTRTAADRYLLTAVGTRVKVIIQRGQIPAKYRGVSTTKMAREARHRLLRRDYKIENFAVKGKTARITFSGTRQKIVPTEVGPLPVEVPWRGRLRWVRQTDHRTYQSVVTVPEPEEGKAAVRKLREAASSLRVPSKKTKPWDRATDAVTAFPLLGDKVGSWMPGWRIF